VHVEAVPAAAACNLEARRLARLAKAGRQEPAVHLLDRVVSVAGAAAREGLTAKRGRPEMAPQRLEEVGFVPGNGMALAALDPQDLVLGAHEPSPEHSRRVSPRRRRTCAAPMSRQRRRRESPGNPAAKA